jgi:phenylacetate-CoA ligase
MQPGLQSRTAIATSQLEQLRALLTEIFPANKFYSQKLNSAGITFDVASLEDFSNRFPFTRKSEIAEDQRAHPPFGTNLTYPLERYTRQHQTSGTKDAPLRWLDTPESWDWMLESWGEVLRAAGVEKHDRIYFAFSFGPFIGFWMAFEAAARLGALCIPGGGLSSAARVKAILETGATVLCCTPTYALRLAEVAAQEKIDLRQWRIKKIIVAGEPGGSIPAIRSRMEQLWSGARAFDHHGMTEVGPVTYECPERPGVLHVIESAYYAEIIEPATGKPVPTGQPGELVLTTLGRIGSPLLRYRTGDLVKADAQPCKCGRAELALLGGILGRTDDMIVVRGVNIYPSAVEEIIRAHKEIVEYQVQVGSVNSLAEMSIRIEADGDAELANALAAKLEKTFQTQFALRVPVTSVPSGTLPRFEMKAKRWVKV